jgi:hypothetical protein
LRSGKSNTNCDSYIAPSHAHSNSYVYRNADSEPDTYSSCRTDRYSSAQANAGTAARAANAHCHGHAKSYPYTERYSQSDSATSAFAATAPITIYEKETHCSTPTSLREHAKHFDVRYP